MFRMDHELGLFVDKMSFWRNICPSIVGGWPLPRRLTFAPTAADLCPRRQGEDAERLVSGSDDFTLFLWRPEADKKCVSRMAGHQQLVNDVRFSPDTRLLASASFDKSVKLWDGRTGKYARVSATAEGFDTSFCLVFL